MQLKLYQAADSAPINGPSVGAAMAVAEANLEAVNPKPDDADAKLENAAPVEADTPAATMEVEAPEAIAQASHDEAGKTVTQEAVVPHVKSRSKQTTYQNAKAKPKPKPVANAEPVPTQEAEAAPEGTCRGRGRGRGRGRSWKRWSQHEAQTKSQSKTTTCTPTITIE